MNKKYLIMFSLVLLIFVSSCMRIQNEKKLEKLGENYVYMMKLIDSYYSEMAHYPLPIWIYDDADNFDSFIQKLYGWDKKLVSGWNKMSYEMKRKIIAGEIEITDNMDIEPIQWIIKRRGKDKLYSPFWGDIQYDFSYNIKRWDVNIKRLKDPFSEKKESIRYSLHYPSCIMCFISNGADMDKDINEKEIFGNDLFKEYNAPDINLIYDPTNGIRSNGDIFFTKFNSGINFKYDDIFSLTPALRNLER